MTTRHQSDYALQAAALHHYALKCRKAIEDGGSTAVPVEQLQAFATRADQLARVYERLQGASE
jgi:hypothetical protein